MLKNFKPLPHTLLEQELLSLIVSLVWLKVKKRVDLVVVVTVATPTASVTSSEKILSLTSILVLMDHLLLNDMLFSY